MSLHFGDKLTGSHENVYYNLHPEVELIMEREPDVLK